MATDTWESSIWAADLPQAAGSPHATALHRLSKTVCDAESEYDRSLRVREDSLQQLRMERFHMLNKLRARASSCTCDPDLRVRLLCAAHEQTVQTFRASRKCELDLVLAKTDHLQAILDSAENVAKVRDCIRFRGVLVALVFLIGIALIMALFPELHLNGPTVMGVPTCVIFWSAVGSFASMLYRFTHAWDGELEDPVRWLFSRPLTGIVMGSIAYLILKAGLLVVAQQSPAAPGSSANTTEVMWLIAFLAGFSDRFSHALLRSLAGRFGGNTETEFATSTTHRERRRVDDTQLDGTSASVEVETTEVKVAAAGQNK